MRGGHAWKWHVYDHQLSFPRSERNHLWIHGYGGRHFRRKPNPQSSIPSSPLRKWARGPDWGLATSYGIIEDHGGRISVRSKVGEGTTFTIELPTYPERTNCPGIELNDECIREHLFIGVHQASGETVPGLLPVPEMFGAGCPWLIAMDILPNQVLRHIQYDHERKSLRQRPSGSAASVRQPAASGVPIHRYRQDHGHLENSAIRSGVTPGEKEFLSSTPFFLDTIKSKGPDS